MKNLIRPIFEKEIIEGRYPGVQYAVVTPENIQTDFVGYRRILPIKELLQGDELYDVASLTKVIVTTTLIMKLIETNRIHLESRVSEVLPRFRHQKITVFDLMTHRSGLPADLANAKSLKDREEVLNRVYQANLVYETGTHIVYSDLGFILLGLMVESLFGNSLQEIGKSIIFDPLGMKDTGYLPNKDRSAPTEYRDDDVYRGYLQGDVHDEKAYAMGGISGHAGLFSTAQDIARFIQAILNDRFVLKSETVDMMFVPRVSKTNLLGTPLVRALGWDKPTTGSSAGDGVDFDETILHTGFTGCNLWIDRKHQMGFVLLSNDVHPSRETKGILSTRARIGNILLPKEEEKINEKT